MPELQKVTLDRRAASSTISSTAPTTACFAVVGPVNAGRHPEGRGGCCSARGTRRRPTSRWSRRSRRCAPINEKIETPDKANAEFLAGERFQMSQNDPDYPAMVLASYMFGEPITSRISDRIRNREGLSYGANARITVPAEGDVGDAVGHRQPESRRRAQGRVQLHGRAARRSTRRASPRPKSSGAKKAYARRADDRPLDRRARCST